MRWVAVAVLMGLASPAAANTEIGAMGRVPVVRDVRGPGYTEFLAIEAHAALMTREAFTMIMSPRFLQRLIQGVFEPFPDRRTTEPKTLPGESMVPHEISVPVTIPDPN